MKAINTNIIIVILCVLIFNFTIKANNETHNEIILENILSNYKNFHKNYIYNYDKLVIINKIFNNEINEYKNDTISLNFYNDLITFESLSYFITQNKNKFTFYNHKNRTILRQSNNDSLYFFNNYLNFYEYNVNNLIKLEDENNCYKFYFNSFVNLKIPYKLNESILFVNKSTNLIDTIYYNFPYLDKKISIKQYLHYSKSNFDENQNQLYLNQFNNNVIPNKYAKYKIIKY